MVHVEASSSAPTRDRGPSRGAPRVVARPVAVRVVALACAIALAIGPVRVEAKPSKPAAARSTDGAAADLAKEAEQLLGALEYERARERLEGAVAGNTLRGASVTARAKIWALLGRARAELGDALGADEAFEQAVALDRRVRLPKSTSPKILDALERARANAPAPGFRVV